MVQAARVTSSPLWSCCMCLMHPPKCVVFHQGFVLEKAGTGVGFVREKGGRGLGIPKVRPPKLQKKKPILRNSTCPTKS